MASESATSPPTSGTAGTARGRFQAALDLGRTALALYEVELPSTQEEVAAATDAGVAELDRLL